MTENVRKRSQGGVFGGSLAAWTRLPVNW